MPSAGPRRGRRRQRPLEAATRALERGWSPIPIPAGSKAPDFDGWEQTRYASAVQLEEAFPDDSNIGVLLGAASNGLVDIDLDSPEARRLAPSLLPRTGLTHGRKSTGTSHYWYVVGDEPPATKRYQDLPDRGRRQTLVELRSTGGQTIIAPSVHPSGELIEWHDDGEPTRIPSSKLRAHVGVLAACSLLARHWPGPGARHDAFLALAGGLLQSGWSLANARHLVVSLAHATDDEEADQRGRDVETTHHRLEDGQDVVGWGTLASILGDPVVRRVREWLPGADDEEPDATVDDIAGSLRKVGEVMREGVPPVPWLVEGVLYRGSICWWQGEPGAGKTLVAQAIAAQLMKAGHDVLFVDEESGVGLVAERFLAIGVSPEVVDRHLTYLEMPGLTMEAQHLHALFSLVNERPPALVIFDSAADFITQARLSEDSNDDVTRWVKAILEPLKQLGCCVMVIDHITKNKEGRGNYARGAGAKLSKADCSWRLYPVERFDREAVGKIRLRVAKNRKGVLPPQHTFRIGTREDGRFVFERLEVAKDAPSPLPPREESLEGRILAYLSKHADGAERAVTGAQLRRGVTGKTTDLLRTARDLAEDPSSPVRMAQDGQSTVWWVEALDNVVEVDFGVAD